MKLNDDPAFAAAAQRLAELRRRRADLEQEQQQLASKLETARPESTVVAKAKALISGRDPEDVGSLRRRLGEIAEELRVLEAARELTRAEREKTRDKASRAICAELAPRHRKVALRVIHAAKELAAACEEELAFHAEIAAAGVYPDVLPPVRVGDLGSLSDVYGSRILSFLADAYRWGLVPLAELPEALRTRARPRPPGS